MESDKINAKDWIPLLKKHIFKTRITNIHQQFFEYLNNEDQKLDYYSWMKNRNKSTPEEVGN